MSKQSIIEKLTQAIEILCDGKVDQQEAVDLLGDLVDELEAGEC